MKNIEKKTLKDKMKDDDFTGFGNFGEDLSIHKKTKNRKPTSISLDQDDLSNIDIIFKGLYLQDEIRRSNTEIIRISLREFAKQFNQ